MISDQFSGVQSGATPTDSSAPLADVIHAPSAWGKSLVPDRAALEAAAKSGGMTEQSRAELDRLRALDADCAKAWAALDALDWVGNAAGATTTVWEGRQAYGWTFERIGAKYHFSAEQVRAHFESFGFSS